MLAQLIRKYSRKIPAKYSRLLINLWPPFLGAGIKIVYISPDHREIKVRMKLRWYNTNYVGTHFGGSLYSMTEPFYMMILLNNLGRNYIVWDKAAKIEFKKPGRGTVHTHFVFSEEEINDIKSKADELGKYVFDKPVDVVDDTGEVIASALKTIYVRRR